MHMKVIGRNKYTITPSLDKKRVDVFASLFNECCWMMQVLKYIVLQ